MNRACFPKEKHQNSQKWAKFMSFSFWPFLWFAGATPEKGRSGKVAPFQTNPLPAFRLRLGWMGGHSGWRGNSSKVRGKGGRRELSEAGKGERERWREREREVCIYIYI